jgi:hypothetical protein
VGLKEKGMTSVLLESELASVAGVLAMDMVKATVLEVVPEGTMRQEVLVVQEARVQRVQLVRLVLCLVV